MNLIEGGKPRIGCIRRQPSAGSLILSLEEGHPSMGKIAGSGGNTGWTSGAPQLPGDRCSGRGDGVQAVPLAAGTDRVVTCEELGETKSLKKFGSGLIRRVTEPPRGTKQQQVTSPRRACGEVLEAW